MAPDSSFLTGEIAERGSKIVVINQVSRRAPQTMKSNLPPIRPSNQNILLDKIAMRGSKEGGHRTRRGSRRGFRGRGLLKFDDDSGNPDSVVSLDTSREISFEVLTSRIKSNSDSRVNLIDTSEISKTIPSRDSEVKKVRRLRKTAHFRRCDESFRAMLIACVSRLQFVLAELNKTRTPRSDESDDEDIDRPLFLKKKLLAENPKAPKLRLSSIAKKSRNEEGLSANISARTKSDE